MPKKQEKTPSLQKDMEVLSGLGDSRVQNIVKLLKQKRPPVAKILEHTPAGFLRLMLVYSKLLEAPDASAEAKEAAGPVTKWFEEKIPDVTSLPGFKTILKQSVKAMGTTTVSIPRASSDFQRNISKSMGIVNAFHVIPFLAGEDLLPSLRVFMRNRDHVLLDSSGDWDDWLYVVKCLLISMEEQSESLAKSPSSWKSIDWEKVTMHLPEIKKALRSFDGRIKDNAPSNVRVSGRRKKK